MNGSRATDDPRRRLLIQALTASVFVPAWLRGQAFAAGRLTVHEVIGAVTMDGKAVQAGTPIAAGATLRTAADSQLIAILDKLAIILRAESEVTINDQVADLRVIKGNLLAAAAPGKYRISTSFATIVQRGRDKELGVGFYLEAKTEFTYFCTCYGVSEISVNDDENTKRAVSAEHHDQPVNIYPAKNRKGRILNAPFKNHTDDELKLIGSLIGHIPPFMQG